MHGAQIEKAAAGVLRDETHLFTQSLGEDQIPVLAVAREDVAVGQRDPDRRYLRAALSKRRPEPEELPPPGPLRVPHLAAKRVDEGVGPIPE